MSVCLDAFALLAWLQDESGADAVEEYLIRATEEEDFKCYLSTINLGEIFYRLIRIKGIEDADAFAVQTAHEAGVPLVTGDPELKELEREDLISLRWIGTA